MHCKVTTAVRYLDLNSRELRTMSEPPAKETGYLRIVVISDTHGWKFELARRADQLTCADEGCGRVFLPKGDILLHCVEARMW